MLLNNYAMHHGKINPLASLLISMINMILFQPSVRLSLKFDDDVHAIDIRRVMSLSQCHRGWTKSFK